MRSLNEASELIKSNLEKSEMFTEFEIGQILEGIKKKQQEKEVSTQEIALLFKRSKAMFRNEEEPMIRNEEEPMIPENEEE
jgi:hypothetical protein